MSQDEILKLAKDVGFGIVNYSDCEKHITDNGYTDLTVRLELFANAIQSHSGGNTKYCSHEPYHGKCVHCGVAFVNGKPLEQSHSGGEAVQPMINPIASVIFNENEEYTMLPIGRALFKLSPNIEYSLYLANPDQSARIKTLEQACAERDLRYRSCDAYVQELQATNAKLVEQVKVMREALERLTIGTCSCHTKTDQIKFHRDNCTYKIASESLALTKAGD